MIPTVTRGATHNFQKPVNWEDATMGQCGDLQVRAELLNDTTVIELFSTWKPSAEEIALIVAGGVIEIGICTASQPAMQVGVVAPVEPALIRYVAPLVHDEHGPAQP